MATCVPYERAHLTGVIALCEAEGWPSFPADPERAHRVMTAPGVTTVVATDRGEVAGFACLQSDGEIQAHLSLIAVAVQERGRGIGRALVADALTRAGGVRVDLITDSAEGFYKALLHRRMAGFRLWPPLEAGAPIAHDPPDVRDAGEADRQWVAGILNDRWGATLVVSRGRSHDASTLPALVAEVGGQRLGLATYRIEGNEAELVTLDALVDGRGIGTALLDAVADRAVAAQCRRLWLITSNDNLDAVRFYQRRGLRIAAVHRGAVDEARRIKPQIPEVGEFMIPVHDEIELELELPRPPSRSTGASAGKPARRRQ